MSEKVDHPAHYTFSRIEPIDVIEAWSAGCLCKPIPLYGTDRPAEWVNAFILGYLGKRSDTLYTIPIMGDRCILPGGTEISA